MAKDPAFLFYPNDYIGGTMGMTFEEKGAYMELLMMQFNRGHMTSHMIGQTIGQLWDTIKVKFVQDEKGLWYNERLEIEKEKRRKYTESRRNNKSGKNQHSDKPKKEAGHMTSHMEDENRNEDISEKKGESEGVISEPYQKILAKVSESIQIPAGFHPIILTWLKYKSEKAQSYKPTGLESFIKKLIADTGGNPQTADDWIEHSMSNNYSGVFPSKNGKPHKNLYPEYKESSFD